MRSSPGVCGLGDGGLLFGALKELACEWVSQYQHYSNQLENEFTAGLFYG